MADPGKAQRSAPLANGDTEAQGEKRKTGLEPRSLSALAGLVAKPRLLLLLLEEGPQPLSFSHHRLSRREEGMEQKVPPGLRPSCPTSLQPRTSLTNCTSREEAASGPRPQAASDFLAQTKL